MDSKKKNPVIRLVAEGGNLVDGLSGCDCGAPPLLGNTAEVPGESLDSRDSGVIPFHASYLLDASLWDTGLLCDFRPLPFAFLQLLDDIAMDGLRHIPDDSPVYGFMQPENGMVLSLRSALMGAGRPQKAVTPKDIISQILIDNVEARWRAVFPHAGSDKDRLEALSRRSGVGKETLRMMMKGVQSPRIDTVDKVARALGTTCASLLSVASRSDEAA